MKNVTSQDDSVSRTSMSEFGSSMQGGTTDVAEVDAF